VVVLSILILKLLISVVNQQLNLVEQKLEGLLEKNNLMVLIHALILKMQEMMVQLPGAYLLVVQINLLNIL